jgi:1,4-alpha-glucan branching enzyme
MIKKTPRKNGTVSVTFELPAQVVGDTVHLVGDFNEWSKDATPMTRRKDGRHSATVSLKAGAAYRYRYLVDGHRWENDWSADAYAHNEFGGDDSVVEV